MNFKQKIADFVTGNRPINQHPDIAITALTENLDSESLVILAGMTDRDNSYELEQYFNLALAELNIELPTKKEAALTLIEYYLRLMLNSELTEAYPIMIKIDNDIYKSQDWDKINGIGIPVTKPTDIANEKEVKFLGQELGLEHLFTWYRELSDLRDDDLTLYYTELPKHEQTLKFQNHLHEEARTWLKKHT